MQILAVVCAAVLVVLAVVAGFKRSTAAEPRGTAGGGNYADPGAMCYKPGKREAYVEYVCPVCGEKTLYAETNPARKAIESDIPACRRLLVAEVKGLKLILDESQFCRKCSPGVTAPKLGLVAQPPDKKDPHRCWGVTPDDMTLVREFAAGETKHRDADGRETPMKDHAPRIRELLGIQAEPPAEGAK